MTDDPRAAYDRWHARLDVDEHADTPWHDLVRRHLDPDRDLSGRRVLEIGAGRGGFAASLAENGGGPALYIAADYSRTAARKGSTFTASRGAHSVRWEVADIRRLGHGDGTFHTIISCETVEHVPEPTLAVRELARVLKPGGRLLLTTPNYLGPMGLYRAYLRVRGRPYTEEGQPINHLVMLPRTLHWVRAAGLRVEAVDAVGHYLPFPGAPPRRVFRLDRPRPVTKWFALHSLVVARRP